MPVSSPIKMGINVPLPGFHDALYVEDLWEQHSMLHEGRNVVLFVALKFAEYINELPCFRSTIGTQ